MAMDGPFDKAGEARARFPSEKLTEIPYDLYTDEDLYRQELETIYRGPVWNYLALACEIPEPGDYVTTCIGETPVIVTRDRDGQIHAMENRCAHRGRAGLLEAAR